MSNSHLGAVLFLKQYSLQRKVVRAGEEDANGTADGLTHRDAVDAPTNSASVISEGSLTHVEPRLTNGSTSEEGRPGSSPSASTTLDDGVTAL